MTDPITVIYITSQSHSGLTLLCLLLESSSQILGLGELSAFSVAQEKYRAAKLYKEGKPYIPRLKKPYMCGGQL